jgi:hypothetical protein
MAWNERGGAAGGSLAGAAANSGMIAENRAQAGRGFAEVERRPGLEAEEFFLGYVAQNRPVLVPGALRDCPALTRWSLDYLRSVSGGKTVRVKQGLADSGVSGLRSVPRLFAAYLDELEDYEARLRGGAATAQERPAYLHDVPLASLLPGLEADLEGFPHAYFPGWYGREWWRFAQFFLGPSHSLTPLHFDCLLTHNLFFQVAGRKRFTLLPHGQHPLCYRYQWRWFEVDPENPDGQRHPLYENAEPAACVVGPGDMLYMPPGMLHHVRSLDLGISFNVDWHTKGSALNGVWAARRGMPAKNVYYNAVVALGLCLGIPARRVLPFYRSYLNYVS